MIQEDPKITYFRINRPELFNYVLNEVMPENKKFKVVRAPVKSGKRGMVEIYSLLDKNSVHVFLTALHRITEKTQHKEVESYGIKVFSVNNKTKKDKCIEYINSKLEEGKEIKIHLDELDFGCGGDQLLNQIYSSYKNEPKVNFILYSATIEVAKKEFLLCNNVDEFHECAPYNPPSTYFGIKKYLENNKFFQASAFFDCDEKSLKIKDQGKMLITKLINATKDKSNKRHIGVLRAAGNFKINGKLVSQFEKIKENKSNIEQQYGIRLKFVGSNDIDMKWDDTDTWEELNPDIPFIIVINQVSGRSTEWKCHPYIVWYHTLRTDDTPASTINQDQERPVYYTTNYTDDINIEIYGDFASAQYSAGLITFDQYNTMTNRKMSSRLDTKNKNDKKHITVKPPLIFDTWEQMPEKYRKGRSKNGHVKDEYKLKETMVVSDKTYKIKNWSKFKHLEGFIMTNVRSSRDKFLNGKPNQKPIWFKSDLDNELGEGINEKNKIRINLFYADGEKDPTKYKFMIREFDNAVSANFINSSMYSK